MSDFPVGSIEWERQWKRQQADLHRTDTLESAWSDAVSAGLGADVSQSAATLGAMRERAPESYAQLDAWKHGALERIVAAYESGEEPHPEDSAAAIELHNMAAEFKARRGQ